MGTAKKYVSPEKSSFLAMHSRCANRYDKNYGGRGIAVCARWSDFNGFENFLADMGPRPEGHSLDRIDVNGDYSPENCRWADAATQARNTRRNIRLEYQGRVQCLEDWSRETGIPWTTIYERLHSWGWPVERALTEPATQKGNRSNHGTKRRKAPQWEQAREKAAALGVDHLELGRRALLDPYDLGGWLAAGKFRTGGLFGVRAKWDTFAPVQVKRVLDALELIAKEKEREAAHAQSA